ncbi:hypothetical protein G6F23_014606 [Rhizopus arrhizus]|nr:hypothetical protein G6F23_014606 [Rhizopus arrhizus]
MAGSGSGRGPALPGEALAGGGRPGSGTASGAGDLVQQPLAQQADRAAGGHATLAFIAGHAGDVQPAVIAPAQRPPML